MASTDKARARPQPRTGRPRHTLPSALRPPPRLGHLRYAPARPASSGVISPCDTTVTCFVAREMAV